MLPLLKEEEVVVAVVVKVKGQNSSRHFPVVLCHRVRDDLALRSSKDNSRMAVMLVEVVACITCLVPLEEEEGLFLVGLEER